MLRKCTVGFLVLLFLLTSNGCLFRWLYHPSPSPSPSTQPTPSVELTPTPTILSHSIVVSVFDKNTEQPLSDVRLRILETGQDVNITTNPYEINLDQGSYTFYISKPGFIARGIVVEHITDSIVNIFLSPQSIAKTLESLSGKVTQDDSDYTYPFSICTSNGLTTNYSENIMHELGLFDVQGICGNEITVSAFTKIGDSLTMVKYLKTPLTWGLPVTDLVLELPLNATGFSGSKPVGDMFVVKLNNGKVLARQASAGNTYDFDIEITPEDALILESSKSDSMQAFFTRKAVGNSGGTYNLQYETEVPDYTTTIDDTYYILNLDGVGFATYYEVYAVEVVDNTAVVPFQAVVLSENGVKIPKDLFNASSTATSVYLRAIYLENFDPANLLNATQVFDSYSYTECQKAFTVNAGSLARLSKLPESVSATIKQTYHDFNLQYLCLER